MATHSSILPWKIPWVAEPGWLQAMGSQRVRHDLVTKQGQTLWKGLPGIVLTMHVVFLSLVTRS